MRKHFSILALVMILCLAFLLPIDAIKIAPYSQPLHDIMHWDAKSAKLIIMNPEGESQTVAWPATVDLWNYNGNSWTFDLPDGDVFAFSKRVNFNIATTEGAGSTVRGISLTDTVGAANAIHEGIRSHVTSAFMTGSWCNAVVGVITYSATGSAGGGMAAPFCSELNMQPAASSGGSYYNVHSYFNIPTSATLIDSTAFNYAFELYELAGAAATQFDLYGLLWHIVGLTDVTTKVWYNNTLKIQIDTTKWWIPLSEAEGSYTTSYPITLNDDVNLTFGTGSDITIDWNNTKGALVTTPAGHFVSPEGISDRYRLTWVAGQRGKPSINADIQEAAEGTRMIVDPDFEVLGTGATSDDVTFYAEGGVTIETDGTDGDGCVVLPHLDANQSAWTQVTWGTDKEVRWECHIRTGAAITTSIIWAGLKLTNTATTITDANQVFFRYEDDVNDGEWEAVSSIADADDEHDTDVAVAINTDYHLVIEIASDRTAKFYINGVLVETSAALTDTTDLIPYIGIEEDGASAAMTLHIKGQAISRAY